MNNYKYFFDINIHFARDIARASTLLQGNWIWAGSDNFSGTHTFGPFFYWFLMPAVFLGKGYFPSILWINLFTSITKFFAASVFSEKRFSKFLFAWATLTLAPILGDRNGWINNSSMIIPLSLCLIAVSRLVFLENEKKLSSNFSIFILTCLLSLFAQAHLSIYLLLPCFIYVHWPRKQQSLWLVCVLFGLILPILPYFLNLNASNADFYLWKKIWLDLKRNFFLDKIEIGFDLWLIIGVIFWMAVSFKRLFFFDIRTKFLPSVIVSEKLFMFSSIISLSIAAYYFEKNTLFFDITLVLVVFLNSLQFYLRKKINDIWIRKGFLSLFYVLLCVFFLGCFSGRMRYSYSLYAFSASMLVFMLFYSERWCKFLYTAIFILCGIVSFAQRKNFRGYEEGFSLNDLETIAFFFNNKKMSYADVLEHTYEITAAVNNDSIALIKPLLKVEQQSVQKMNYYLVVKKDAPENSIKTVDRIFFQEKNINFENLKINKLADDLAIYEIPFNNSNTNKEIFSNISSPYDIDFLIPQSIVNANNRIELCKIPFYCDLYVNLLKEGGQISISIYARAISAKLLLEPVVAKFEQLQISLLCNNKKYSFAISNSLGLSESSDKNKTILGILRKSFKTDCTDITEAKLMADKLILFQNGKKTSIDNVQYNLKL